MSTPVPVRVVKLGGSLFGWDHVVDAVRRWLGRQPDCCNVLVAGGGALADCVRDLDRRLRLEADTSHRLAIQAMAIHAQALRSLMPDSQLLRLSDLADQGAGRADQRSPFGSSLVEGHRLWVLDPVDFVHRIDVAASGRCLPVGWHVTSDSIAARVAEVLEAAELVLLKSSLPSDSLSTPYVDDYFATAAARLPRMRAVNLRDPCFAEWLV
jgi:hypothetical protein